MTIKSITTTLLASSILLSACAEKAANVQSSYASPIQYQTYSCRQISEEAARVSARASQLADVQDKNASNDAVATGLALVVFWPVAFLVGGKKGNKAELARLKGELEALEQANIQKNCSTKFVK